MQPSARRVAARHLAAEAEDAEQFLEGFLRRHPVMRTLVPKRVRNKMPTSSHHHPEASQEGLEIWLFPKFWALDKSTRDFVMAHEIGHFVLSERGGLIKLVPTGADLGLDLWDTSSLPFGQENMEEAFADSFATYYLARQELARRYPLWVKLIEATV
jgi:hypothetical protein